LIRPDRCLPAAGFIPMLLSIRALVQSVRRRGWFLTRKLGTLRTGWLARTRERAGLTGNGPTYLAPDSLVVRICRIAGVACPYNYALLCISLKVATIANSAL
jgi:hypothetical protein